MGVEREQLARRVSNIVATSGSLPIAPVDIVVAMARIDTVLDEFYGKFEGDTDSRFRQLIDSETVRGRQLAIDQSNAILEEALADEPALLEQYRLK